MLFGSDKLHLVRMVDVAALHNREVECHLERALFVEYIGAWCHGGEVTAEFKRNPHTQQ